MQFPTGEAMVEIVPETAFLNVNQIQPDRLYSLLLALGQDEAHAAEVTESIVDWRKPLVTPDGPLDDFYLNLTPSFRPRHASIQEIEELLSVKGMTPDLYYGTWVRDTSVTPPQLVARGGLRDCLSVYGSAGAVDVNGAAPAVLAISGLSPEAVQAVVARRPFHNGAEWHDFTQGDPSFARVRIGGNSMYQLRATARLRLPNGQLSDFRRRVAETVKFQPSAQPNFVVMRWYDRG